MHNNNLLFIVRRLLFSKRNKGIVHIISLISLIGIAVVSLALVVVLSVFNGFTSVAEKMLEKTTPPILVSPSQGKTFSMDKTIDISKLDNVQTIIPVIKQTVMVGLSDRQKIITMIGTTDKFFEFNAIDTCLVNGRATFSGLNDEQCILGVHLAHELGLHKGAEKMNLPIKITIPVNNHDALVPQDMLKTSIVRYSASYLTQSELDADHIIIPINKAREILDLENNQVSALYILPKKITKTDKLIKDISQNLGQEFQVKNLLQQEAVYFRIVKSEKLAVYIILSLIILIATINIISSIIILYIQKERMNHILRAIGMTKRDLRKIYFYYGMMLNTLGCVMGVVLGIVFCLLQQEFSLIKLAQDSFIIEAFPVKIMLWDIIKVLALVLSIGMLSVKIISNRIKIN